MSEVFWLKSQDGTAIYVKKWINHAKQPRAIVQLSHGMVEHIQRYDLFAEFLVANDIFVYGNDHRGHGRTGEHQGLFGYFSDQNGFEKTKEDLYEVTKQIKSDYPSIPIFLFGHSMRSFLTRRYMQTYSHELSGVILSGTGFFSLPEIKLGKYLAKQLPPKKKSHIMNFLTVGNNNRAIQDKTSAYDWLTKDKDMIQAYVQDPYAGFVPTARFFYDLMIGLEFVHHPIRNQAVRSDLPLLLMSGDEDPVGKYGIGVFKTAHLLKNAGIKDVKVMLFEKGRHEMLNEVNKQEVFQAIYDWMDDYLQESTR